MKTAALTCLLCNSDKITIYHSLNAEDILKCWAQAGLHFKSAAIIQPLLDEGMIHLYDCLECGFQFFNPELAGGEEFYGQLYAEWPGYYALDRPESRRNVRFAVEYGFRNILDIGCGSGFALDAAKRAGLETFGVELNRTAVAAAAEKGHTIFPVLLENMDARWEGKFDLISLNQVLEHIPDPVGLIRQCIRLLSPRGAISIAVPGSKGILRLDPWLEFNWPPHHISRWRKNDFYTLARATGLKVVKTGGNQLLGSELQGVLLAHRWHCQILKKPYHGPPPFAIKLLSFVYRKTGMKFVFRSQGHSIYCYLTKSANKM